jgi:predicted PurR-regulated permease PerM
VSGKITIKDLLPPIWVSTLFVLAGTLWVLVTLKEMVVLLVVGLSIAYAIEPLVLKLHSWGLSRSNSVLLLFGTFSIFILLLILSVVPSLVREATLLLENLPDYLGKVRDIVKGAPEFLTGYLPEPILAKIKFEAIAGYIPSIDGATIKAIFIGVWNALAQGYSVTLTLLNLALLPFIAFYLSESFPTIQASTIALFPQSLRAPVRRIVGEINLLLRAFIRGQVVVGAILFVLFALGLGIMGVKLWLLLAVISGFGQIVPYAGFAIGIILSTIMAIVTFGTFTSVLVVWIIYGVIQLIEGFIITPRVVGQSVNMSPLEVIIALFAGGTILGLLGIFLAVPLAAACKVVFKHAHARLMRSMNEASS